MPQAREIAEAYTLCVSNCAILNTPIASDVKVNGMQLKLYYGFVALSLIAAKVRSSNTEGKKTLPNYGVMGATVPCHDRKQWPENETHSLHCVIITVDQI